MRQVLRNLLTGLGYTDIIEANGGHAAYELLLEQKNLGKPIDLVLSDWTMTEGDGLEFLKKVRAHSDFAQLPFMLVTAEGENSQVLEAIRSGASNYLIKPFSSENLKEKLRQIWARQRTAPVA
jgi:two-component system chemotaxis response regulator CheY